MFCSNCGNKVDDGVSFCPECGQKMIQASAAAPAPAPVEPVPVEPAPVVPTPVAVAPTPVAPAQTPVAPTATPVTPAPEAVSAPVAPVPPTAQSNSEDFMGKATEQAKSAYSDVVEGVKNKDKNTFFIIGTIALEFLSFVFFFIPSMHLEYRSWFWGIQEATISMCVNFSVFSVFLVMLFFSSFAGSILWLFNIKPVIDKINKIVSLVSNGFKILMFFIALGVVSAASLVGGVTAYVNAVAVFFVLFGVGALVGILLRKKK